MQSLKLAVSAGRLAANVSVRKNPATFTACQRYASTTRKPSSSVENKWAPYQGLDTVNKNVDDIYAEEKLHLKDGKTSIKEVGRQVREDARDIYQGSKLELKEAAEAVRLQELRAKAAQAKSAVAGAGQNTGAKASSVVNDVRSNIARVANRVQSDAGQAKNKAEQWMSKAESNLNETLDAAEDKIGSTLAAAKPKRKSPLSTADVARAEATQEADINDLIDEVEDKVRNLDGVKKSLHPTQQANSKSGTNRRL